MREEETEREEVREIFRESNPLTMTVLYGTPSAKYDHLGAGELHSCSIIQEESDTA